MKRILLLAAIAILAATLATPAARAEQTAPTLAKSTAEQRALAETVSARIRSALDGEPYTLGKSCDGDECAVSQSR